MKDQNFRLTTPPLLRGNSNNTDKYQPTDNRRRIFSAGPFGQVEDSRPLRPSIDSKVKRKEFEEPFFFSKSRITLPLLSLQVSLYPDTLRFTCPACTLSPFFGDPCQRNVIGYWTLNLLGHYILIFAI